MASERSDQPEFGFSDDELAAQPTVFADHLFKDKTVLVSGAGTGLGRGIAHLFARLGSNLVVCGRKPEPLNSVALDLEQRYDIRTLAVPISIRDPEAVADLMDQAWNKFGGLDVLINNAGGQFPQDAIDFTVKGWKAVIDTNLNGTWYMMQSAARKWIDAKRPGNLVNIIADFWRGMPQIAHTCAARAGVAYLSRSVAVEWAPFDIRVNCIAPGAIETTGFKVYPPEASAKFRRGNPLLRCGDVQDIAEACCYLAAPSGKFVTGECLTVDGGQQLWGDAWPLKKPDYFRVE